MSAFRPVRGQRVRRVATGHVGTVRRVEDYRSPGTAATGPTTYVAYVHLDGEPTDSTWAGTDGAWEPIEEAAPTVDFSAREQAGLELANAVWERFYFDLDVIAPELADPEVDDPEAMEALYVEFASRLFSPDTLRKAADLVEARLASEPPSL